MVDVEIVDTDPDPEPAEFCDKHMPYGTGDSCPDCKIRRIHHKRWKDRNPHRALDWLRAFDFDDTPCVADLPHMEQPGYRCKFCHDTNIVLNRDGQPGSTPRNCYHDGSWCPMDDEELAANAELIEQLNKGAA